MENSRASGSAVSPVACGRHMPAVRSPSASRNNPFSSLAVARHSRGLPCESDSTRSSRRRTSGAGRSGTGMTRRRTEVLAMGADRGQSRKARLALLAGLAAASCQGTAANAGVCDTSPPACTGGSLSVIEMGNGSISGGVCALAPSIRCSPPIIGSPSYARTVPSCDPLVGPCTMTATVAVEFRRNSLNSPFCDANSVLASGLFYVNGGLDSQCGDAPITINTDFATFTATRSVSCSDASSYRFDAAMCGHGPCGEVSSIPLDFVHSPASGCPVPLTQTCTETSGDSSGAAGMSCPACQQIGGDAGCSVGDGKQSCAPAWLGNARLRYAAGGVGGDGLPGTTAWRTTLGRFWSHDYAERVVVAPDNSHVWLVTRFGSFREFSNLAAGSGLRLYQTRKPSDEFRKLFFDTATGGWQLQSLDGRTDFFRSDGLWVKTAQALDPDHPTKATYGGSQLTLVEFPDGRSDSFTYYPDGKLHEIIGVPVVGSGTPTRTWTLTWSGDLLDHVDRPDGTTWQFYYDATRPGYLTRIDLVSSTGLRVMAAFSYLAGTNDVEQSWRGDPSFTGSNAVDKVAYTYTNPAQPTQIVTARTVSPTFTQVTTYNLGRDTFSNKPKVISFRGSCPTCGLSPTTTFAYAGPNPL